MIDLFTGKISDVIVHEISDRAIDNPDISKKYLKEIKVSLDSADWYRKKINPIHRALPMKDIEIIKERVKRNVKSELMSRIKKGYKDINLDLVDELVNKHLRQMNVV